MFRTHYRIFHGIVVWYVLSLFIKSVYSISDLFLDGDMHLVDRNEQQSIKVYLRILSICFKAFKISNEDYYGNYASAMENIFFIIKDLISSCLCFKSNTISISSLPQWNKYDSGSIHTMFIILTHWPFDDFKEILIK